MSLCANVYPPSSSNTPRADATPIHTVFQNCGGPSGCPGFGITSISVVVHVGSNQYNASSASMTVDPSNRKIKLTFLVDFGTNTVTSADVSVLVGSNRLARFSISGINATRHSLFEIEFIYTSS